MSAVYTSLGLYGRASELRHFQVQHFNLQDSFQVKNNKKLILLTILLWR